MRAYEFYVDVHVDRVRDLYMLVASHRAVISFDLVSVNGKMWKFHIFGEEDVALSFEGSISRIKDILSSALEFEEA